MVATLFSCFNTAEFNPICKQYLLSIDRNLFPLQKGTSKGGFADGGNLDLTVISSRLVSDNLIVLIGCFFEETMVGCSCGDDPVPEHAYCEMEVTFSSGQSEPMFLVVG